MYINGSITWHEFLCRDDAPTYCSFDIDGDG